MLRQFLMEMAQRPFEWGRCDCTLMLADWWLRVHEEDPAKAYRGTYATADECAAILKREGGRLRLIARQSRAIKALRTLTPGPGDFGVVRYGGEHVPAIMTPDGRWAGKSLSGLLVFTPEKIAAAWKI